MTLSSMLNNAMTEQMRNVLLVDAPVHIPRPPIIPRTAEEQYRTYIHELTGVSPAEQIKKERIKAGADSLYLKHKAIDLATGSDTATEAADTFTKAMKENFNVSEARKAAQLTPAERETYTKICNDVRPQKSTSWASSFQNAYSQIRHGRPLEQEQEPGPGEREIYSEYLKNLESRKLPLDHEAVIARIKKQNPSLSPKYKAIVARLEQDSNKEAAIKIAAQEQDALQGLTSAKKSESDAAFQRLATRFRMDPDTNPTPAVLDILLTRNDANLAGKKIGSLVGKQP